ncbi:MAG: hypothetical protein C5B51_10495 [Terriglobia bacterium]|nr:MAG: hypothetical protein C5B51_10495 [Terriglobia bacterium]
MRCRVLLLVLALRAGAANATLDQHFQTRVRPFVAQYCAGCHSGPAPAGGFNLKAYTSLEQVRQGFAHWEFVRTRLAAREMPPEAMPQPPDGARQQVIDWIEAVRKEARKQAGDPGIVLTRRLSNAEYDYTIRDLTGQDLRPAREFPVDPANPEGFDNSGESLTMSAALLNKYLQAARSVADHLVFKPDGLDFAPHPMLVETDRDKYAVQRILNFYLRQPTDFADYFEAAWRYRYRAALGKRAATLASTASEARVSPKYLPMVWEILHDPDPLGPIARLQAMWNELPAPGTGSEEVVRAQCREMRKYVRRIRRETGMQFAAPRARGLVAGSQPLLYWKNLQFALHRRESDPEALRNDTDPPEPPPVVPKYPDLHQEAAPRWAALVGVERARDRELSVPADDRRRYEAAFARFASVFPDGFYVSERGRYFPDDSEDKGRLLSAGYHNTMGYFRDDQPLMEVILDDQGRQELNRLWNEFDFIAAYTERTWVQYFFNQSGEVEGKGAEAGSPRPADHEVTDEAVIMALKQAYLDRAAGIPPKGGLSEAELRRLPGEPRREQVVKSDPVAPEAIRSFFDGINATLRGLEKEHREAEPKQLVALLGFAERAYRRPLADAERADLRAYYRKLRDADGLSQEAALRETVVSVLMSPDVLYRVDPLDAAGGSTSPIRPLAPYALAGRLSYFLWASMPDRQLMAHAASGDLEKREVLLAEVRRMVQDPRVHGMAAEFGGNWLDFRHFETNNTVDRDRFPEFNHDLREAMFQEPVRFLENMMRNNASILDLLYGDYTFVNPTLASHYGMPPVTGDTSTWVRVDDAGKYERGGILPMAVFLTENSPGLRTSPVKRGYWVVHRVLGQVIPPPPPVVPELPSDESKTELPLRDMLARHRSNPVCAACHAKFDAFGLAFEGYGPVGQARTNDLAGRPVDAHATFPGGGEGAGLQGLRDYIREHRQADFIDTFIRKLLAYALNRSLELTDEPLVEETGRRLASQGYRFEPLVEAIVTSPQFRNQRNPHFEPPVKVTRR